MSLQDLLRDVEKELWEIKFLKRIKGGGSKEEVTFSFVYTDEKMFRHFCSYLEKEGYSVKEVENQYSDSNKYRIKILPRVSPVIHGDRQKEKIEDALKSFRKIIDNYKTSFSKYLRHYKIPKQSNEI